MIFYQLGISALLGLGISMGVIWLILRAYHRFAFSSREETHHGSGSAVPRFGGIALAVSFVGVILLSSTLAEKSTVGDWQVLKMAAFALLMFGLGLWDDFSPLGAKRKLFGQLLIASAAYFSGIDIHQFQIPFTFHVVDLGIWSCAVTIFWLVAITNLINLIDGVDGLAGGICLMLMFLMAYVGNGSDIALVAAGMTGALLGFLRYNFPPARIYMGDGGAYFLGFLIASMTIVSSQKGTIFAALTAPLFVLALPILDTTLAIMRRGVQGLPLFRPDRGHIHHRLLETGLSRRRVVLGFYAFTAFFLVLGFTTFWCHGQHLAVLLGISALVILLVAGRLNFSREWFAVGRVLGNSLQARSEIQYALAQSRWLALEGMRSQNINELCEDVVFIARKLGYAGVRIRLEDGEKTWRLSGDDQEGCRHFQHKLPGHRYCFLELLAPRHSPENSNIVPRPTNEATFKILSDLLAEGWAKAVGSWERQRQLPVRFDDSVPLLQTKKIVPAIIPAYNEL